MRVADCVAEPTTLPKMAAPGGGGDADAALARALQAEENATATGANDEALAQQLASASLSDGPSFAVHGAAMRTASNPAPIPPAFHVHSIPRWKEIDPKVRATMACQVNQRLRSTAAL